MPSRDLTTFLLGMVLVGCVWLAAPWLEWLLARPQNLPSGGGTPARSVVVPLHIRAHGPASWLVSRAGDATYDGPYAQAGTRHGRPYYKSARGRCLYWDRDREVWLLGPRLGDALYAGAPGPLPANPWRVLADHAAPPRDPDQAGMRVETRQPRSRLP